MSWIKTLDRQDWVHLNGGIGCRHPMLVFSSPPRKTRWWFSTIFYFHPEFWEDEPILTSIFSRWVGSTTNEKNTTPISDGSKNGQENLHRQLETTQESIAQRMDFSQVGGETGNGWGQLRNGALVTGARNDQGEKTTDTFFFGGDGGRNLSFKVLFWGSKHRWIIYFLFHFAFCG